MHNLTKLLLLLNSILYGFHWRNIKNNKFKFRKDILYSVWKNAPFDVVVEDDEQQLHVEPIIDIMKVSYDELQAKWIEICMDQSKEADMDSFSFSKIIHLIKKENTLVEITNDVINPLDNLNNEIYITEQELQNAWLESSKTAMGKLIDKFNIKESLLLLDDEEYTDLMDNYTEETNSFKASARVLNLIQQDILQKDNKPLKYASNDIIENKIEYIVTKPVFLFNLNID
jgi:hypothetical protein